MALQENVNVGIIYGPELVAFGTRALNNSGKVLRRVSSSLAASRDSFSSAEARVDLQVSDMRLGMHRPGGTISGELTTVAYDDFLQALMRGTWTAGISRTNTEFTSMAADNVTSKFTVAASTWQAQGFKVGDVIRFSNLSDVDNNNRNFRITSLATVDAFVTPAPDTMAADTSFTVVVQGNKLTNGVVKRSFSIEQSNPDIDVTEIFDGCRIGGGTIRIAPNGMATVDFDVMAQKAANLDAANAPYFVSPTAAGNQGLFSGVSGAVRLAGVESAVVTGLDFGLTVNLSTTPVIGSVFTPEIFYGRTILTGNCAIYLENKALLDAFLNETEVEIISMLTGAGVEPLDFLTFRMHRVKFTGVSKTITAEGGVIASLTFQALLKTGGAGTDYDTSTLVIQRSNT